MYFLGWSVIITYNHLFVGLRDLNEKYLFHGTKATDPMFIWRGEEGFDFRFSNFNSLWGLGSYFASDASYSHGFAHTYQQNGQIYYQMFVAKVLTGKFSLIISFLLFSKNS